MPKNKSLVPPSSAEDEGAVRRQKYNKLARTAQLGNIFLVGVKYDVKPEIFSFDPAELHRIFNHKILNLSSISDDGVCVAQLQWVATVKIGKKNVVRCVADYVLTYSNIHDVDHDILRVYIDAVAAATSYSYFRGLYAQLDWGSGVGSPPLPTMQFFPKV